MSKEDLKLSNQVCFSLYAASRLVIQNYKPYLDELGITYPQYLVLLVLWEQDEIPVKEISEKLFLESNTLTPLLKRMETNGLLTRNRSTKDERVVTISLTSEGKKLNEKALEIPNKLKCQMECVGLGNTDFSELKNTLKNIVTAMRKK